jgi:hypothetical protein
VVLTLSHRSQSPSAKPPLSQITISSFLCSDPREEDRLEQVVDVHAFTPGALRSRAEAAGFERVRVGGEELAASLFGWVNRTLEATAEPSEVPWSVARLRLPRATCCCSVWTARFSSGAFRQRCSNNLLVSGRAPA